MYLCNDVKAKNNDMLEAKNIGEYDPPLPERIKNPTKADYEKLEELKAKYKRMKESRLKD